MSDPLGVLQPAVRTALAGATAVTTAVGAVRVYDRVPDSPTFPYLRLDISDVVDDDNGCGPVWEVTVQIHIWSRHPDRSQASLIAGPVRAALDAITNPTGYVIDVNQFRSTRMLDDPDGLTTHGIVQQRLRIRRAT